MLILLCIHVYLFAFLLLLRSAWRPQIQIIRDLTLVLCYQRYFSKLC
uniref:Uncharacterized protein n=1 Tax=Anguilla anguilla TaxID=7936 RepID=A0A0E9RH03_ANGAN